MYGNVSDFSLFALLPFYASHLSFRRVLSFSQLTSPFLLFRRPSGELDGSRSFRRPPHQLLCFPLWIVRSIQVEPKREVLKRDLQLLVEGPKD